MQATKTGGLSGKARRKHVMSRASRRHADNLLADYFNADSEEDHTRRIPIKPCSAYLERGVSGAHAGTRGASGVQHAVDAPSRKKRRGEREVVWPPSSETVPKSKLIDESLLARMTLMPEKPQVTPDRVIRFQPRRTAKPAAPTALPFPKEWRPPMAYRSRRRTATFGGFAYGCLLGSAAAAVMLLIVRVVIG